MMQKKWFSPKQSRRSGFSMIEILIVIGIIGVLVAAGSFGFVQQMNRSRLESATSIVNSVIQQARQSAIAMRQARRVGFDAGALEDFPDTLSGQRTKRVSLWVEGKVCEDYKFDTWAACNNDPSQPNAYQFGDITYLPDNVMIAGVGGENIPGVNRPAKFYIEFNARGGVRKVYFEGEEATTDELEIAAVIHLARDNETITYNEKDVSYQNVLNNAGNAQFRFDPPGESRLERYKVQTIEVIYLTGRTRIYDYAYQNPWPSDEPKAE